MAVMLAVLISTKLYIFLPETFQVFFEKFFLEKFQILFLKNSQVFSHDYDELELHLLVPRSNLSKINTAAEATRCC